VSRFSRIAPTLLACSALAAGAGVHAAFAATATSAFQMATLEHLTLQEAEKLFVERNRELQAARRAVESSEADIIMANARPNPTLSIGTTQISPSQGVGSGSVVNKHVDTVVGVSQLFERGGKRGLRTGVAEATAAAVRNDRGEVERQQRIALAGAYYDLLFAQDKLAIVVDTAGSYRKLQDASKLRLQAGDIAATDLARLTVDALRAENDSRVARAELARAQLALAYLIGVERDAAVLKAGDAWPGTEPPQPASDLDSIVEARSDVGAARARIAAAERGRELARAQRTRDITAGVSYERFPGDASNNSFGFFVSVPLFTNYYFEGEIRKSEVEYDAAQDNLERVRALAVTEISRSRADLDAAWERVQRSREAVLNAAERAAKGAEFAYSHGAIGITDLLDARRQLYATRLEGASVQSEYAKALSAWRAAITASTSP